MLIVDNVRIGTATGPDYSGTVRVTVRTCGDGAKLSITGEVGPPSGPWAAGQVQDCLPEISRFARGWNATKARRLSEIWAQYHLRAVPASVITELQGMF